MKKRQREKLIKRAGGYRSIVAFTPTGEYVWANINWKARNRRWMYFNVPWPMKNMPPVKTVVLLPHLKRPGYSVFVTMAAPAIGGLYPEREVELSGDLDGLQPAPFATVTDEDIVWRSNEGAFFSDTTDTE